MTRARPSPAVARRPSFRRLPPPAAPAHRFHVGGVPPHIAAAVQRVAQGFKALGGVGLRRQRGRAAGQVHRQSVGRPAADAAAARGVAARVAAGRLASRPAEGPAVHVRPVRGLEPAALAVRRLHPGVQRTVEHKQQASLPPPRRTSHGHGHPLSDGSPTTAPARRSTTGPRTTDRLTCSSVSTAKM